MQPDRLFNYTNQATRINLEAVTVTDTTADMILGDSPRCFIGSTFKIYSDAAGQYPFVLGQDYELSQYFKDSEISKSYGEACYSRFKFTKQTGIIYVTYDIIGSYTDADVINDLNDLTKEHTVILENHDQSIQSINNRNNEQDLRLSDIEAVNTVQQASIDDHEARVTTAEGEIDTLQSDVIALDDRVDGIETDLNTLEVQVENLILAGGAAADTLDGYHADATITANSIPVRNASGAIPGDITGSAGTLIADAPKQTLSSGGVDLTDSDCQLELKCNDSGAVALAFHRPGAYATKIILGTDNKFHLGGWSAGQDAASIVAANFEGTAFRIRQSAPASPVNGDIWME